MQLIYKILSYLLAPLLNMPSQSPPPTTASDSSPPSSPPPPPLSFHRPQANEKIPALTLIAHSIAQQRQIFIHRLTLSPFILLPYLITVLLVCRQFYRGSGSVATLLMINCAFAIAALTLLQKLGERYLDEAGRVRSLGVSWWDVGKRDGIVAVFGSKVVGVIAWDPLDGIKEKGVEVVAWTVMMKYRRKGLGGDLLEKCVAEARKRYGAGAKVKFARDHANSMRVFQSTMFHGDDVKRERKAKEMLDWAKGKEK